MKYLCEYRIVSCVPPREASRIAFRYRSPPMWGFPYRVQIHVPPREASRIALKYTYPQLRTAQFRVRIYCDTLYLFVFDRDPENDDWPSLNGRNLWGLHKYRCISGVSWLVTNKWIACLERAHFALWSAWDTLSRGYEDTGITLEKGERPLDSFRLVLFGVYSFTVRTKLMI
jgi:hypothetical protein